MLPMLMKCVSNLTRKLIRPVQITAISTRGHHDDSNSHQHDVKIDGHHNVERPKAKMPEAKIIDPVMAGLLPLLFQPHATLVRDYLERNKFQIHDINARFEYTGYELNGWNSKYKFTPLNCSCKYGSLDVVKMLVEEYGAEINPNYYENQRSHGYGWSYDLPIYLAMESGHEQIVLYLVTKGSKDPRQSVHYWMSNYRTGNISPNSCTDFFKEHQRRVSLRKRWENWRSLPFTDRQRRMKLSGYSDMKFTLTYQ